MTVDDPDARVPWCRWPDVPSDEEAEAMRIELRDLLRRWMGES